MADLSSNRSTPERPDKKQWNLFDQLVLQVKQAPIYTPIYFYYNALEIRN
jgi:hypothetical protein